MTVNLLTEQSSDPNSILPLYFGLARYDRALTPVIWSMFRQGVRRGLIISGNNPQAIAVSNDNSRVKIFPALRDIPITRNTTMFGSEKGLLTLWNPKLGIEKLTPTTDDNIRLDMPFRKANGKKIPYTLGVKKMIVGN